MKKIFVSQLFFVFLLTGLNAQKYFTRTGTISFFSEAPLEKIEATNNSATSIFDLETGNMEFAVLIKGFQFEKALMQEHFNENYMESSKFPKATFKGQIAEIGDVDFSKDGEYPVKVKGALTIHGETQEVETEGKFVVKEGAIAANASFEIAVADYKIEIPKVVRDNIAKIVRIDINSDYKLFKKGS